jgi:uncharacterized membrane protein YphA (DoxX/SURF4 family)
LNSRSAKVWDWLWRLPLGAVFIYAAVGKIADPAAFAAAIDGYRLFPRLFIGPLAIVLPWLELSAGLSVLTGFWKRPAALILAALLCGFMLAAAFNLYRGLDFQCGCFGSGDGGRRAGLALLAQDALLLFCAAAIWLRLPAGLSRTGR